MSEDKFHASDRTFLNEPGFHTDATMCDDMTVSDENHFIGEIRVRDCSSSVYIELDAHSDEWMKNSEAKIATMITMLQKAKRDLRKARTILKHNKKKDAKNTTQSSTTS